MAGNKLQSTLWKIWNNLHDKQGSVTPVTSERYLRNLFLSIRVFFHDHSRTTGLQGKEDAISLTPHYHFHPLHRHLGINRVVTAESSPLDIGSSWTRTGNFFSESNSLTTKLRALKLCSHNTFRGTWKIYFGWNDIYPHLGNMNDECTISVIL